MWVIWLHPEACLWSKYPTSNILILMTLIIHQPDSCKYLSAFELFWLDFIYIQQKESVYSDWWEKNLMETDSEKGMWHIIFWIFMSDLVFFWNFSFSFPNNHRIIFGQSAATSARYPASILLFPVSLWTIVSDCLRYGRDGRKVQNNLRK